MIFNYGTKLALRNYSAREKWYFAEVSKNLTRYKSNFDESLK